MKVKDVISHGIWKWPVEWSSEFPFTQTLHAPTLNEESNEKNNVLTNEGQCVNYTINRACKDWKQGVIKFHGVIQYDFQIVLPNTPV